MIQHTATALAELCGAVLEGDGTRVLVGPASLADAGPEHVTFVRSARQAADFERSRAGAVVVPRDLVVPPGPRTLLRSVDPSRAFSRVVEAFRPALPRPAPGLHPSAVVDPSARIGEGASVGPLCHVAAGAEIGARSVLHAGVVLGPGARVGPDCVLHANVVLYDGVTIGARCLLHAGTVLGSDGFGFEPSSTGWDKVPQCGTVVVGDDVEMGANCAIDRGRFGATRIGNGVKFDNLVHLAHNVVVEDGALLIAQVGVAGSSRIGTRAIIAGQAGVGGHITVGAGARVGGQSGVGQDVPPGSDHFGTPSRDKGEALRIHAMLGRLGELFARVKKLERQLVKQKEQR